jgi:hypothetical protein
VAWRGEARDFAGAFCPIASSGVRQTRQLLRMVNRPLRMQTDIVALAEMKKNRPDQNERE